MTKKEILLKLDELPFSKDDFLIVGGASLVCHGIKKETSDIDLSCSKEFFELIDWPTKMGYFNTEIKYFDCFEIGTGFYSDSYDEINGYHFLSLEDSLNLRIKENRDNDRAIIKIEVADPDNELAAKIANEVAKSLNEESSNNKKVGTLQKYITTSNLYWDKFLLDTLKEMYFLRKQKRTCV